MKAANARRSFGDLTLTGFAAAGCVVLLLLAATYWVSLQQRRAVAWVEETNRVLRVLGDARAALVDIQNGHRGFTIEGSEEALKPYREGVAAVQEDMEQLRALLAGTPQQQANLAELQRLLRERLDSAARLVEARRSGGFEAVKEIVDSGAPAAQMEALRSRLEAMETQQDQLLQQRLSDQERGMRWFGAALAAITLALAGTLGGLYLQVRRRQRDQQQLQESEERFRLMAESVVDYAIVILEPDGRVRTWNAGAERILGYREDEIADSHFSRFYPEQDASTGVPTGELHVAMLRGHCAAEGWRVRRDGSRFWATMVLSAMRGSDGLLRGFSLVLRDLTERRQAEEWLRSEMAERARVSDELQRLNRSLEGIVATRTRDLQRANGELEAARRRLQELSSRLIQGQEQERGRVARELHDETGQTLTAVRMKLVEVQRGADPGPLMKDSIAIIDRTIAHIRDLALRLRPTMLDDLGLVDALEWVVRQQARSAGWTVELDLDGSLPRLPSDVETACFRIVQECVANAAVHARAATMSVKLRERDGRLEIEVEDDGLGFRFEGFGAPRQGPEEHFGLFTMAERARLVGGSFEIDTAPGQGVRIRISVPIPPEGEAEAAEDALARPTA
ncbi:MAG TPA: CHASE3 domain-containing protein [Ramlibacter sp.]|uniref:CHASE3 domain-containing protein n=1 Tax=Ramlibacter sp. TaxID=1917967 RepID=UPI002D7E7112|nr:CHASE3 domain-containing protein [Ramlibacter sp.]HET8745099.1 CHASE3 domain-containing protein [Ramlibacter sp.]